MAIIKIDNSEKLELLPKSGVTIYEGEKVSTIRQKSNPLRHVSLNRSLSSIYLVNSAKHWKSLSIENKTAWREYAEMYPFYPPNNFLTPLTGEQLFIKRNTHLQIYNSNNAPFIVTPSFVWVPFDELFINLFWRYGLLYSYFTCDRSDSTLDCLIYLSRPVSPGVSIQKFKPNLLLKTSNFSQIVDISTPYQKAYGSLPKSGELLIYSLVEVGKLTSFYYYTPNSQIIVP